MRRNEEHAKQTSSGLMMKFAIGLGSGIIIGILLLMLMSALILSKVIPEDNMRYFVPVAVFGGALLPGFIFPKLTGKRFVPIGALSGVGFFLVLYLLGIVVFLRMVPTGMVLYNLIAGLAGGTLGGYLAGRGRPVRR